MDNSSQDVGATAFDLPNDQDPRPHFHPFYGSEHVPHPTNASAKVVDKSKVMGQVLSAK